MSNDSFKDWELQFKEQIERKELAVNQAKNAGLKDSMKISIIEEGDMFLDAGEPGLALKTYMRLKDIQSTKDQQYELYTKIARAALQKSNFSYAQNICQKAISVGTASIPLKSVVQAIVGVCHLESKNYKQAARAFLEVKQGQIYHEFLTDSDIAIYTTLCALISFDRSEVKNEILKSKTFGTFLEEEPRCIEILDAFLSCRYFDLIQRLNSIRDSLRYDLFIGAKLSDVYLEIKNRAIADFLKPFKRVKLDVLAHAFNSSVEDIEKQVARLIMDGTVEARIDSHNKIIQSRFANEKVVTYREALNIGKRVLRNNESMLLRMNMVQQKLIVKDVKKGQR
mmetsp:Transcript_3392/g.3115  ORF Transcript_3392/g.3115 Transcript_3392/m.3115 type:complete len:339 (+) Transcript_3392:226-1242(+)